MLDFLIETVMAVEWRHVVMWIIGGILIYLAIKKDMEPALLLHSRALRLGGHRQRHGRRGARHHHLAVQRGYRGERSHAHPAVHRHRGDDRFRTASHQSQTVHFGRRGAAGHLHHPHFRGDHRLPLERRGVHRHHRRGGRPHRHPRRHGARLQLSRTDHGGRLFVHGTGAHHSAVRRQVLHVQKGTAHPHAL